jgi:hypothetical protein
MFEATKRGDKQVKEHLVNYILYINNILVKVKLRELVEHKDGLIWEQRELRVGVTTRCPASGLVVACLLVACLVWVLDTPTSLIWRLGQMQKVKNPTHCIWVGQTQTRTC